MNKDIKKWNPVAYFFGEGDDDEWLVLENDNDENQHICLIGENLRDNKNI